MARPPRRPDQPLLDAGRGPAHRAAVDRDAGDRFWLFDYELGNGLHPAEARTVAVNAFVAIEVLLPVQLPVADRSGARPRPAVQPLAGRRHGGDGRAAVAAHLLGADERPVSHGADPGGRLGEDRRGGAARLAGRRGREGPAAPALRGALPRTAALGPLGRQLLADGRQHVEPLQRRRRDRRAPRPPRPGGACAVPRPRDARPTWACPRARRGRRSGRRRASGAGTRWRG